MQWLFCATDAACSWREVRVLAFSFTKEGTLIACIFTLDLINNKEA